MNLEFPLTIGAIFPVSLDYMVHDDLGFSLHRGEVRLMEAAHRHQELELNLIFRGSMTYLFGGNSLELKGGQFALFWATTPHRLIACEANTEFGWLTLPLVNFLRYGLAEQLVASVLQGRPVITTFSSLDNLVFNRWLADDQNPREEHRGILELELEAWLRRVALDLPEEISTQRPTIDSKMTRLAQYISEHYQQPLDLGAIAAQVSFSPSYTATLFKRSFGMTINDYVTQHRVAHAQRLLITTKMPILELAFEAGFGSSSQFYAAFSKACGTTPGTYRRTLRHGV